jgi:hypothetical protein
LLDLSIAWLFYDLEYATPFSGVEVGKFTLGSLWAKAVPAVRKGRLAF